MPISMNPNDTFNVLSHPPDFAILFNSPGKKAKNAKGKAIAKENPTKPMIGPRRACCWLTSTKRFPMNGAVHENETNTSVSAIKNIPEKLLVFAFESALFVHLAG